VAVRRGVHEAAKSGHAELAEVPVGRREVPGAHRGVRRAVVAPGAEAVVAIGQHRADAAVAARVGPPGLDHERAAGVVEFAAGERGAEVAQRTAPVAHEAAQAPERVGRVVANGCCRVGARGEGVAQRVEAGARRLERLDPGRERLGDLHAQRLPGRRRVAERRAPEAGERRVARDHGTQARVVGAELARIAQRTQDERPQRIGPAVPAEPVQQARVGQPGRVAVERPPVGAEASRTAVGESQARKVAAHAGASTVGGQSRLEEQPATQLDRRRVSGRPIAGVAHDRWRPRSVGDDGGDLVGRQRGRGAGRVHRRDAERCVARRAERRRGEQRRRATPRRPAVHRTDSSSTSRSARPSARSSITSCQRPGMWNRSPSARTGPGGAPVSVGR
jgi:hypothetical protein